MKNKFNSTLTLLIVLVFLGAIAWWLTTNQEKTLNKDLVLNLPEPDIFSFDITKVDEDQQIQEMSIRKNHDNNWVITAPVKDSADPETISIMTASLRGIRTPTIIKNVADLSEYGLDKPSLTVMIHLKKGKSVALKFGSESPIPEMYYACLDEGRDVVVIGKDIKDNLSPKLAYLRERKVVNVTEERIRELTVKIGQDQVYRIVNTDEKWSLIEPYRKELLANNIKDIIDGLNALWSHKNDDDLNNMAKYGLDQPQYQVEIILLNGESFSVIANKIADNYYMFNSLRPTIIIQMNPNAFSFLETFFRNFPAEDSSS